MRILLVNEEDFLRNAIGHILIYDGHEVTEASGGVEAYNLFAEEPYPLVICDLNMTDIDGIELTKKIKEISPESEVIIITSSASIDTAVSAMRNGAYDYLIKNLEDFELISDKVRRVSEKIRLNRENRELLEKLEKVNEFLKDEYVSLSTLAMIDSESGLYNNEYFKERILIEVKRSKRHNHQFSLLFIDLGPFIQYYEGTGGDGKGLKDLGRCFKSVLRRTDAVMRYSDTKIAILLPETPKNGAYCVIGKLRSSEDMAPCFGSESHSLSRVTVNVGVSTFPEDGDEVVDLIRSADAVSKDMPERKKIQ